MRSSASKPSGQASSRRDSRQRTSRNIASALVMVVPSMALYHVTVINNQLFSKLEVTVDYTFQARSTFFADRTSKSGSSCHVQIQVVTCRGFSSFEFEKNKLFTAQEQPLLPFMRY